MAALTNNQTNTEVQRVPAGRFWDKTFRVTTGAAQATDWIVTGFTSIDTVVGFIVHGTTPLDTGTTFELNARGTGVAEDTNHGDLGIETEAAEDVTVTVRGF